MRFALAPLLLLAACATPTTGVVPTGTGYYTVARQGSGAWVTTQSLKADSLSEAEQFCAAKGLSLQVINVKEIPSGPFGRWPESEVTFGCQK